MRRRARSIPIRISSDRSRDTVRRFGGGTAVQGYHSFRPKLIEAAPDRVIWGTDWPHPNVKIMPNDGDLVDLIPLYAPDPAMQRKLLIENPERLFKFRPT
ncbi:MAG: hypothetical protein JWL84_1126 [Rhodospirillales bacterium]|jgi:predicted TIM-barrel fold metal-dependent hydrolase|nr:hypothetical protein [Rhodospirillales bacterium]